MAFFQFFADFNILWYLECNTLLMMSGLVGVLRKSIEVCGMIVRDVVLRSDGVHEVH